MDAPTAEAGWVTVICGCLVHPPVATTSAVYVPALRPVNTVDPPLALIVWVTLLSVTEYGAVPPLTVTVTVPFEPPKQLTPVCDVEAVKPALNETGIGVTKSSREALSDVDVLVLTKTE